jgi:hypothetical protein
MTATTGVDRERVVRTLTFWLRPEFVLRVISRFQKVAGFDRAVFAMISALFCVMVVLVGAAAAGREINDELGRIQRGERPADDEVQRQWDEVTTQARLRWQGRRELIQERRHRRHAER